MKLIAGRLVPEAPPEDFWVPEIPIQIYDPWSCAWYDVVSVVYVGGVFIVSFRYVTPPIEVTDIGLLEARIDGANV